MKVFLGPADWDEALHESKPVIQLDVSARSYIGDMAMSGPSAVERAYGAGGAECRGAGGRSRRARPVM